MILPDINVLVSAYRRDTPHHQAAREWLQRLISSDEPYGMAPDVLAAMVRVVTSPRVFKRPDPLDKALAFTSVLADQPHCQIILPGPRHWTIFRDLCRKAAASGNLMQEAWFAALAIDSGCEWNTLDRGYARFPGLRCRVPF